MDQGTKYQLERCNIYVYNTRPFLVAKGTSLLKTVFSGFAKRTQKPISLTLLHALEFNQVNSKIRFHVVLNSDQTKVRWNVAYLVYSTCCCTPVCCLDICFCLSLPQSLSMILFFSFSLFICTIHLCICQSVIFKLHMDLWLHRWTYICVEYTSPKKKLPSWNRLYDNTAPKQSRRFSSISTFCFLILCSFPFSTLFTCTSLSLSLSMNLSFVFFRCLTLFMFGCRHASVFVQFVCLLLSKFDCIVVLISVETIRRLTKFIVTIPQAIFDLVSSFFQSSWKDIVSGRWEGWQNRISDDIRVVLNAEGSDLLGKATVTRTKE